MQIYRAEDGEVFQVNKTLQDIERFGTLERFLYDITGVEETAVLAYLSDGRRLRDENLRELAGAEDQIIFVFNKHYLDYELEDILTKLRVDPSLEPEIDGDVHMIANAAASHYDFIIHVFSTLHVQHEALRIASTSLDLNVLSISDAFEAFAGGGRRELEKQSALLQGLELDLDVISKIRIHPEFLSPAARKAVEAGEKARTLGDYVSNVKMRQVGDACSKTHNELRTRFNAAEDALTRLSSGADDVRSSIVNSGLVEEAELCTKRSHEALERITETQTQLQEPRIDEVELLSDIRKHDVVLRDEVQLIADLKNKSTVLCMRALRHISQLTNDLVVLPQMLNSLQSDFRAKTSFVHIQRLHNMLYAYGATLVEIVRRKEFSRFFSQRAQTVAEIMAKLSSSERKRRQIYRGEVHGLLPFDAKGMDDSVPIMEITTSGIGTSVYTLERDDLMTLLDEIDKIDQARHVNEQNGAPGPNPLIETRSALEKLIIRMDNLESTFDKMAEKTIFSASRAAFSRRQATDHTDGEFQELVEQLHELQDAKGDQERQFEEDRHMLQTEIETLHLELRNVQDKASHDEEHITRLENELHHQQAQYQNEAGLRRDLAERETQLLANLDDKQKYLTDAESEAVHQAETIDSLRQELAKVTQDFQKAKGLEMDASEQVMKLVMEKELQTRSLEDARAREEGLSAELSAARQEVDQMKAERTQALEENDRRLRSQISDADRTLRDVIAEADGDRAVLEHQCFELKGMLESMERQLKESKAEIEVLSADGSGLREELQRAEHDLQELRSIEGALRSNLQVAEDTTAEYKMQWEDSEQLAQDLLRVATAFRDSHCKAFAATQSSSSSSKSLANLADSTTFVKSYIEPPELDPESLSDSLQILLTYDFSTFNDAVTKQGSTIRKWQKQCKEYRDRAKGKISFRNFAKGDLALFLPTRNSISKPWAAFNVSFPHYFLQASGHLAEQLKTREWIVARITSIMEQVASIEDPSSNPFGLANGTKFYMLKVEDWTQASSRRKSSPPKLENAEGSLDSPAQAQPGNPDTAVATSFPIGASETSEVILDASMSSAAPFPGSELPGATSRVLLTTRQRTHSAPAPQASSLSRLLAQGTPSIEEVAERSSPSPPHSNSRPTSPLGQSVSPLQRCSSSSARPSSPLARPSPPRTPSYSPLAERPHVRPSPSHSGPSSPLAQDSRSRSPHPHSRPHSRTYPHPPPHPTHSHHKPSSPTVRPISPTHPYPPSPRIGGSSGSPRIGPPSPLAGQSPVQRSPRLSGSPLHHPGSRRSSSSSRPSNSSVFSASRHPLALATAQPKAAATTALTEPNVALPSVSREHLPTHGGSLEHLPGESPSWREGSERRRAISGPGYAQRRAASSSQEQSYGHAQGALASLASSWGFGKKKGDPRAGKGSSRAVRADSRAAKGNSRDSRIVSGASRANSEGSSTAGNGTSVSRSSAVASDILRRYDDILP